MADDTTLSSLLPLIRTEIRAQKPYIVGGADDISTKLNQNESPYDLPPALKRELLEAIFQIPFNRYPTEQPERLMEAIAADIDRPVESIIVGNGSNELTYTLGLCLLDTGADVVVPRPMFALYESMIRMFGGKVRAVAPREDLSFDTDGLVAAVRAHDPVLTIVTTPNNPTGLAMPLDDIRQIVEAANGFVVVDEAYHEFNPYDSALQLMDEHPNVIVMRTLSKAMGLAGLRLGYLTAHPDVATEFMKSRLPFMVDRLSETVGLALIRNRALIEERVQQILRATDQLAGALESMGGVEVIRSHTNFLLFRTPVAPADLMTRCADLGVLVRNVSSYPELPGYLRVTTGTERENKAFLTALKAAL